MEEIFPSTKDSNKYFLREAFGKELSGGNVYLACNSINRNKNSE